MTVKRFILYFLFISCLNCCKQDTNDDCVLLEIVLNDGNYTVKDSLIFKEEVTNKSINNFFKQRKTENIVLTAKSFKKGKPATKTDSAAMPKRRIISVKEPVTRNDYIMIGKGIDKKAEAFLKDSFNYKSIDSLKWVLNDKWENIFVVENKDGATLNISKPVYNLDKNKAIVYTSVLSPGWWDRTLYFLSKENGKWIIIYKETRR
ncbi:MAG: hypothetical protein AAFX55_14435 [Bacteroidota bacterium]